MVSFFKLDYELFFIFYNIDYNINSIGDGVYRIISSINDEDCFIEDCFEEKPEEKIGDGTFYFNIPL